MTHLQYEEKVTKTKFEATLINDFGVDDLSASPYSETSYCSDSKTVVTKKMTLYYVKGEHAGTWMNGVGWIFKSAYET